MAQPLDRVVLGLDEIQLFWFCQLRGVEQRTLNMRSRIADSSGAIARLRLIVRRTSKSSSVISTVQLFGRILSSGEDAFPVLSNLRYSCKP
jgi:hypothetical protein